MRIINANDFVSPGAADADIIQRAIDAASPGDTVRIPRFHVSGESSEWHIGKALLVGTGVTVLLDNCRLVLETGIYDNMFRNRDGASGFSIIGEGSAVLSGGEWNYLSNNMSGKYGLPDVSVNALLKFRHASHAVIRNIRFEMARWASVMIDHSEDVRIEDLWFEMVPHVKDLYGVLIGCGCRNISIENLTGRTGDDTVYIFADSKRYPVTADAEIRGVRLRNIVTDPKFESIVHIRANGGHKIRDIRMDGIVDSSDFFDKKRIHANVHIGDREAELHPAVPSDISGIRLVNAFSSAVNTFSLNGSFSDSCFENVFTFGDNINIINNSSCEVQTENVRFRRLYYGKGSEPNNSTSFISRYAIGALPVVADNIRGDLKVEKLIDVDEEDI